MGIGVPPEKHDGYVTFLRTQAVQHFLKKLDPSGELFAMYEVSYQEALAESLAQMEEAIPILKQQAAQAQAHAFMEQEAHRRANGQPVILPGQN